jgi:hypothetical protein
MYRIIDSFAGCHGAALSAPQIAIHIQNLAHGEAPSIVRGLLQKGWL